MKPLRKGSEVLSDLADIYAQIGEHNPQAAEHFLQAVASTFEQIHRHPAIGWRRTWKERRLTGIRSWRVGGFDNYLVFYREEPAAIMVYAVLHGARHLEGALKRR